MVVILIWCILKQFTHCHNDNPHLHIISYHHGNLLHSMGGHDIWTPRRYDWGNRRREMGKAIREVLHLHIVLGCADNNRLHVVAMVVSLRNAGHGSGLFKTDKWLTQLSPPLSMLGHVIAEVLRIWSTRYRNILFTTCLKSRFIISRNKTSIS